MTNEDREVVLLIYPFLINQRLPFKSMSLNQSPRLSLVFLQLSGSGGAHYVFYGAPCEHWKPFHSMDRLACMSPLV